MKRLHTSNGENRCVHIHSRRPGAIFLITVLIIGTIVSTTALSLMLLGLASQQSGFAIAQSQQAFEYGQLCAERALRSLRQDLTYIGSGTTAFSLGSCVTHLIGGTGNVNRTVCIEGRSGTNIRRFEIVIDQLLPTTKIHSWNEVPDITLCP